jgi:hypothetical protein
MIIHLKLPARINFFMPIKLTVRKIFWSLLLLFSAETMLGLWGAHNITAFSFVMLAPFKQVIVFAVPFYFCFANNIKKQRDIEPTALIPLASLSACVLTFGLTLLAFQAGLPPFAAYSQAFLLQEFLGDLLPYSLLAPVLGCIMGRLLFRRAEIKKQFFRLKW